MARPPSTPLASITTSPGCTLHCEHIETGLASNFRMAMPTAFAASPAMTQIPLLRAHRELVAHIARRLVVDGHLDAVVGALRDRQVAPPGIAAVVDGRPAQPHHHRP